MLAVALVLCLSATLSACQEESAPSRAARQPASVQEVLLAATPIESGESLADALAAGRFELAAVPGADLLPGAVSSTSGLAGVATRDVAEGEQITADLFR